MYKAFSFNIKVCFEPLSIVLSAGFKKCVQFYSFYIYTEGEVRNFVFFLWYFFPFLYICFFSGLDSKFKLSFYLLCFAICFIESKLHYGFEGCTYFHFEINHV